MTIVALRWRQTPPPIVTRWRFDNGTAVAATVSEPLLPTAAIIGPQGPAGSTLASYEHVQSVASASWTVNHNLGRWPAGVTIVTTGGVEVEAAVTHVSTAQLVIAFATPFAGRARII